MNKTILLILLCPLLFAFDKYETPTTYANIAARLNEDQKALVPDFDYYLKFAQENNLSNQYQIAKILIKNPETKSHGIDLYREIYDIHGLNEKNINENYFLEGVYTKLARAYLKAEHTKPQPILAIKILLEVAQYTEDPFIKETLGYQLAHSDYFPDAKYLVDVWSLHKPNKPDKHIDEIIQEYEARFDINEEEPLPEPEKALFKTCDNQFSKDTQILKEYYQRQKNMIKDGVITDEELKVANHFSQKRAADNAAFQFDNIDSKYFLNILIDALSSENDPQYMAKFNDDYPDINLDIFITRFSAKLIYQQALKLMNLDVLCHQDWVMFTANTKNPNSKSLFISNYIIKKEDYIDNEGSQISHIIWNTGLEYKGGFVNGLAQGKGRFTYNYSNALKSNRIVEGNFIHGKLSGRGKDYRLDGTVSYIGEYKNGLFHGNGHWINKFMQIDKKGQFVNGQFSGKSEYYYEIDPKIDDQNSLDQLNFIKFEGVFNNDIPDGSGHCYLTELDYKCEFYKGYLISVDGVSILPDNIKLN